MIAGSKKNRSLVFHSQKPELTTVSRVASSDILVPVNLRFESGMDVDMSDVMPYIGASAAIDPVWLSGNAHLIN